MAPATTAVPAPRTTTRTTTALRTTAASTAPTVLTAARARFSRPRRRRPRRRCRHRRRRLLRHPYRPTRSPARRLSRQTPHSHHRGRQSYPPCHHQCGRRPQEAPPHRLRRPHRRPSHRDHFRHRLRRRRRARRRVRPSPRPTRRPSRRPLPHPCRHRDLRRHSAPQPPRRDQARRHRHRGLHPNPLRQAHPLPPLPPSRRTRRARRPRRRPRCRYPHPRCHLCRHVRAAATRDARTPALPTTTRSQRTRTWLRARGRMLLWAALTRARSISAPTRPRALC
jgi:hypothetical protein